MDNYQAVSNVVYDPGAFSVLPGSDFSNLDELVAFATENPNVVTYATTGIGGDDHLAALNFSRLAGIEMVHIPFSGSADVRAAVLGGHVKMAVLNISESGKLANEGQVVVLGQMGNERWANAPDVPTFKEQGYDVIMGSDRGIGAPAGFPDDALVALQDAIAKAVPGQCRRCGYPKRIAGAWSPPWARTVSGKRGHHIWLHADNAGHFWDDVCYRETWCAGLCQRAAHTADHPWPDDPRANRCRDICYPQQRLRSGHDVVFWCGRICDGTFVDPDSASSACGHLRADRRRKPASVVADLGR